MSLYDRVAARPGGGAALASARLRRKVLVALNDALAASGATRQEMAGRLGVREQAVSKVLGGDGNVRAGTLAEHLHALGYELDIRLVPAGELRGAELREALAAGETAAPDGRPGFTEWLAAERQRTLPRVAEIDDILADDGGVVQAG